MEFLRYRLADTKKTATKNRAIKAIFAVRSSFWNANNYIFQSGDISQSRPFENWMWRHTLLHSSVCDMWPFGLKYKYIEKGSENIQMKPI